jgi:hypothetical protein
MRTNEARLSVLVLALSLSGCWEPKSHEALQRSDGAGPGGTWEVCEDAAVGGVSGDACAFTEGVVGCLVPEWELAAVPTREAPEGTEPATFHAVAGCQSSRGTLIRSEKWESTSAPSDRCDVAVAIRTSDGCIGLEHCGLTNTYCVPDALLPAVAEAPLVVLESAGDCEALLADLEARPGSPCSGEQICDVGFPTTPEMLGAGEPLLVWCHAERLRFSVTSDFPGSYENVTSVWPRL